MDSPGLLDRPISKRNNIELQAILALRLISDLILFVFDPTPSCGYNIESQINLYNEIKENFSDDHIEILPILNKKDLASEKEIHYLKEKVGLDNKQLVLTNALTGENLEFIKDYIKNKFIESN